jgi:hypothetical protein
MTDHDHEPDSIYIGHLPKDVLLYELWSHARTVSYAKLAEYKPLLTQAGATRDINCMIRDQRKIDLTTYYSRLLYVDLTGDYLDPFLYDAYNGQGLAETVITNLKKNELERTILKYHTFT